MNLKQIEARLKEIKNEVEKPDANITELRKEADDLIEQRDKIIKDGEERQKFLDELSKMDFDVTVKEFKGDDKRVKDDYTSDAYRSAFLKDLLGVPMTDEERAAFVHTTENTEAVIPKSLENKIYSNMQEMHPILGDVKTIRTGTVITIVKHVSIEQGDAKNVKEAEANDDEKNTFENVTLSGVDISKHIDFSYRLGKMSIPAFEEYLVTELAERIGHQRALNIMGQIKKDLHSDNKVEAEKSGTIAITDFLSAMGKTKGTNGVTIYANNNTFYGDIATMVDEQRRISFIPDMQNKVSGQVLGQPVKIETALEDGEILIIDPKQYTDNIVQDLLIERDRNIKTHVHTIAGILIHGGTLTNDKAGVLLTKGVGA